MTLNCYLFFLGWFYIGTSLYSFFHKNNEIWWMWYWNIYFRVGGSGHIQNTLPFTQRYWYKTCSACIARVSPLSMTKPHHISLLRWRSFVTVAEHLRQLSGPTHDSNTPTGASGNNQLCQQIAHKTQSSHYKATTRTGHCQQWSDTEIDTTG